MLRSLGRAVSSFVLHLLSRAAQHLAPLERALVASLLTLAHWAGRAFDFGASALLQQARRFAGWTCRLSQGPVGRFARVSVALSFTATALTAAGVYETLFLDPFGLPDLEAFLASGPPIIGRIDDAHGDVLAELAREYRRPLEDHELPPVLRRALLAAEDKNFFDHPGVDLDAWPRVITKVAGASHAAGRVSLPQGGSTLTQQLVRVAFLGDWCARENGDVLLVDTLPNRVLAAVMGVRAANKARRKLEEIRLALWLEDALGKRLGSRLKAKEEILRRYAMYVYLGDGRYGFAAASEHYLGRPLASLRDDEADLGAVLAGIVKSPTAYSPIDANRERVLRRRNQILHLMERAGYLSGPARARLQWAPLPPRPADPGVLRADATAAVNWVLESLSALQDPTLTTRAVYDGRIQIGSTVDGRLQTIVSDALESALRAYEQRHPERRASVQGSVVVLANDDARVLALVGGRMAAPGSPLRFRDFNRATMSRRQAGSTMKPLVYLTALKMGMTLDSPVLDEPVWLKLTHGRTKQVANYDGSFKGQITLRRALAESRNAATVRLAASVGLPAIQQTAQELGIKSALPPYITTALGAADVTLLELANAYRAIASGLHGDPWIVRSVLGRDGSVLYARPTRHPQPITEPALPMIQEALRGAIRLPGATGRSLASLPFAVIGKTGTTNDYRDALFVGATYGPSGITVAVRIGFDDNRSLGDGETGGRAALPVFREIVTRAYADDVLGAPPAFPEALEREIDEYLVACSRPPQPQATPAPGVAIVPAVVTDPALEPQPVDTALQPEDPATLGATARPRVAPLALTPAAVGGSATATPLASPRELGGAGASGG